MGYTCIVYIQIIKIHSFIQYSSCLLYLVLFTQMDNSCPARLPAVFIVRVTGPRYEEDTQIPYSRSAEAVYTIIVNSAEDCSGFSIQIKARNSAGTSDFSEDIPVGEYWHCSKEECGLQHIIINNQLQLEVQLLIHQASLCDCDIR